jgi:putative endonuclease
VGAVREKICDFLSHEHARNRDEIRDFCCFGIRYPFTAQRKGDLPFFMDYFVYILYSQRLDRYYVGQTNDLTERIRRHNRGIEKYTSAGIPWELVFYDRVSTRGEAMKRERKLKNLKSRAKMLAYMEKEVLEGRGCRERENL